MPSFQIYQSEYAVRIESTRLRGEVESLRQDNNRLRRAVGEEEIAYAPVAAMGPAAGESFKTGNCTVAISAPGAGYNAPTMPSPQVQVEQARQTPEVLINGQQPQRQAQQARRAPMPVIDVDTDGNAQPQQVQAHGPITTTGREGQRVTIMPAAAVAMNPAIAAARAPRVATPVAAPAPAQVTPHTQPEVDTDATMLRMSLLEL